MPTVGVRIKPLSPPRPPKTHRCIKTSAILLLAFVACSSTIGLIAAWLENPGRRGGTLPPDVAGIIATDPRTSTEDRRRAIHRIVTSMQTEVRWLKEAARVDPAVAEFVRNGMLVVQKDLEK